MKPINREILSIAVPSIITNITTPLLALMDVVIVGHMGSADYIAAIALGGTIFNMLYWLFAFLRMGSSGLTAQAHGSGNKSESDLVLIRGLLVVAIASVAMIACQSWIFKLATRLFEIDSNILFMVRDYFITVKPSPTRLTSQRCASRWPLGMVSVSPSMVSPISIRQWSSPAATGCMTRARAPEEASVVVPTMA